ncbi:hypothetical protein NX059_003693 [Plenodomus lindquistii]|nr:hypothetical protein NX059_003693 [Plenodomus lindquistii]
MNSSPQINHIRLTHPVNVYIPQGQNSRLASINLGHLTGDSMPTLQTPEILIGYTKNGRSFLDKLPKAHTTEQQMLNFRAYYKQLYTPAEHFKHRWIYCQEPAIYSGWLATMSQNMPVSKAFPYEVMFESLERSETLSAGFLRPELLRESGDVIGNIERGDAARGPMIVVINPVIRKERLIWPLAFSFLVASIVAGIVGILTQSLASGAEFGGFLGVAIVLLWSYLLWMLG